MVENPKSPNPFEYLNSITTDKNYMFGDEVLASSEYVPFLVNRGLSYHADTVFISNLINGLPNLDKKMQYDYLYGVVPKKKRYSKWIKKSKNDSTDHLMLVYGYNRRKAESICDLLNKDQLEKIASLCSEGGIRN